MDLPSIELVVVRIIENHIYGGTKSYELRPTVSIGESTVFPHVGSEHITACGLRDRRDYAKGDKNS